MKFWITLAGRDAEVETVTEGARVWLEIEGRRLEADFVRLPDGEIYSLLIDGRSREVRVSHAGDALEVTVEGHPIVVEVRSPLEKRLAQGGVPRARSRGETIAAPMPGLIVALRVKVGDVVKPGQAVAVIEAMKMQNELASVSGGVVAEVLVAERTAVAAGVPLVRLAPETAS